MFMLFIFQYATASTKLSVAESRIFSLSGDEIGKKCLYFFISSTDSSVGRVHDP